MSRSSRVRARYERKLAEQARVYERELTDQKFHEVGLTQGEHRMFHEREHILYDDAIEKASSSLSSQLRQLDIEVDRLRLSRSEYLTTARFEREHEALIERMNMALEQIGGRVQNEANVTLKQVAQQELLDKIGQNNRWLIGIGITSALTVLGLVAHLVVK